MSKTHLLLKRATRAALLFLLLGVAGLTNAFAQTFTMGNLNYSINDDGATVTVTGHVDGQNATGELVIPESVELYGTIYPVTAIGGSAFRYCSGLTGSLVIPNSVVTIGGSAFLSCSGFTELMLGNAVQTINSYAFQYCHSLTGTLTIPESVTYISYGAFDGCGGFTSLNYNAINCTLSDSWWLPNSSSLTTLNIGENVQVIPAYFMYNHTCFIGELVIPESVTSIGNNALKGCTGFTSLTMGNSVTSIGNSAFNGCTGFTGSLDLGNSVTSIGESAFNGCSGFTGALTIPNSVSNISTNAFSGCSGFSGTLTLGNSLTQIGNSAFFGACEGFTSFDVKPETPPTLGSNVFTSVDYGIPVQVPCGSLDAYNNASGWDAFTNIQEPDPCMWDITATAEPEEGGTVTGADTYAQGTTCTLTATPNEGYVFVNWTEDGVEVSVDEEYSFTVEGNRNLVAHFVMPTFVITATANPSYAGEVSGAATTETFDFEDQQIPAGWSTSYYYPWTVITPGYEGYNGSFCMRSGNSGVASSTSDIEVTVEFVADGSISFLALCMGEGTSSFIWDKCQFFIDGEQQFNYGANVPGWNTYSYDVSAGTHTFKWSYSKDGSVNPTGDAFFVDDVTFTTGAVYHLNETCTLTATPSSNDYVFVNWTEDDEVVSTSAQYSFVVTGDRDLVANFMQIQFEITASANPEEGGTIEGEGSFMVGQTCTLTATPAEGYEFVNWTEDGEEVSTNASYSFVVANARHLEANFSPLPFSITVTANPTEGGYAGFNTEGYQPQYDFEDGTLQGWTSIDADGDGYGWEVNYGNNAHGNDGSDGFAFSRSWINPNILYPDNYLVSPQFTLGSCITFYACAQDNGYAAEHFGVAVSTGGNTDPNDFTTIQEWTMSAKGGGTPSDVTRSGNRAQGNWYKYTVNLGEYAGQTGYIAIRHFNCWDMFWLDIDDIVLQQPEEITETFMAGSTCTVTAIPNYGYALESWTENGDVVSTEEAYSFTVTGDRSLVANFFKVPFSITATPNFEDWGTVSGMGEYVIDTTCTLTATPAEGHNFVHWLENGQVVSTDAEYTFTVTGPKDLVAVFSPLEGTYIVFADPKVETICVNQWDADGDGFLSYEEAAAVTNLGQVFYSKREITSFDELQYFTGLTYINEYEFYYCQNLTSVVLPENVTSIGQQAFIYCNSLGGTLTINENVNYIGWGAFYGTNFSTLIYNAVNCEMGGQWLTVATGSLTSLTIGENVEVIPYRAFENCYNVTGELVIPNSVTYIGEQAFRNCSGFTSITIPEGITSIEYGTFEECSSAETISLPSTLESIGEWAFSYCNSLSSLVIPNSVTYIGGAAFQDCSSLTELSLPSTLETIDYQTFYGCSSLTGTLELPASVTYIGNNAFGNCSSLTGLVLPEGLVSIEGYAFKNCSGLRGQLTLPESLEYVGGHVFYGCDGLSTVNYNAINCQTMGSVEEPVFYDCAFAHLRIGENVESIPNFAFKHCFLITDITSGAVNPPTVYASTFGMVSRSIPVSVPYGSGDAYRTAQYWEEFFNITEDYSPSQYTYHYNADIHQFESTMTVVGVILIDAVEQATDALEIGAFVGDECRGRQLLAYYPQVDRYLVFLTLYGEDGDQFSFRLYDHEAGMESVKGCTAHLTFLANDVIGTLSIPYPFNFVDMQQTQLAAGWNWWSAYVELTGTDGLGMLEEGLGANGEMVKSQSDGYSSYLEGMGWYGSLTAINNESTYLIKVTEDCEVSLEAAFANPANHPVTLSNGWNWIGYPTTTAMNLSTALGGFEASDDDLLKAQEGFAMYYTGLGWIGSLRTLTPGMGLMYKSNNGQSVTLTYPAAVRQEGMDENVTTQANHWAVNAKAYPHNMNIVAVVELDGTELQNESYEIAAFANGEVRGSARLLYIEPLNRYMAFLTVAGDEAAELRFSLYNAETGVVETQCLASLQYETNAVVGSLTEPYIVSFRGTTGVDEFGSHVSMYPNPVASGQNVSINLPTDNMGKVTVEVVNALGAVLSSETMAAPSVTVKVPETAGVYMLRISSEGNGTCFKKLVVR